MSETKTDLGLLQHLRWSVNYYYHKAFNLGCSSSPRSAFKKHTSSVFFHTAVLNIFQNTGRRVLILVMTACKSFIFKWTLTVQISLFCLLIQLKLTRYDILHHLWSPELSKTFFYLILSILTFSQYFFQ